MNKRIKELMVQSGFDPDAIQRMGVMPNAEKFAELIVRECAEIVGSDFVNEYDPMLSYSAKVEILDRFGLSE